MSGFLDGLAAKALSSYFGSEKGLLLKIAQMMGTSKNALDEFQDLSRGDNGNPVLLREILPIIEDSLGQNTSDIFLSIKEARWVASLGQVHQCVLKNNGGEYVVKVLYPEIKEKIKKQLKLLGLFGLLGEKTKLKKWGFHFEDYIEELKSSLDKETNYLIEKNNMQLFNQFNNARKIYYPVVSDLSTKNVLISTYCEGIGLDIFQVKASRDERQIFSETLFSVYLKQLFEDGFIQGDTHKGNFYVHHSLPVFLDFGHFLQIDTKIQSVFKKAIKQFSSGNFELSIADYEILGFESDKLKYIQEQLAELNRVIFDPFVVNCVYDLNTWNISSRIDEILGEQKWWFRSSGSAYFFQLIRSFMGLFTILKDYGVPINYHTIVMKQLELNPSLQAERDKVSSNRTQLQNNHLLKVEVRKKNEVLVDLSFPARAAETLEDLIDDKIKSQLVEKKVDLEQIKQQAIKSDLSPQTLFSLEDGDKKIKVSITK